MSNVRPADPDMARMVAEFFFANCVIMPPGSIQAFGDFGALTEVERQMNVPTTSNPVLYAEWRAMSPAERKAWWMRRKQERGW